MTSSEKKVRVTVDLSAEEYERLNELALLLGVKKAVVFRDALRSLEYFAKMTNKGWEVRLHRGTHEKTVPLLGVERS